MFATKEAKDLYYSKLENYDGLTFTQREIDIVSCIINGCSASKEIAKFLNIAVKSVDSHKYNISKKLQLVSHLNIREYIEKSSQYNNLKQHYLFLCEANKFYKLLSEISKKINQIGQKQIIIYTGKKTQDINFGSNISKNFKLSGIVCELIDEIFLLDNKHNSDDVILITHHIEVDQIDATVENIHVLSNKAEENNLQKLKFYQNYPESFINLIELVTSGKLELSNRKFNVIELSEVESNSNNQEQKIQSIKNFKINLQSKSLPYIITIIIIFVSLLLYINFLNSNNEKLIKSNLIIPIKSAFLERNHITKKMDAAFRKQTSTQSVAIISLVGPGGSGKTTLARYYGNNYRNASVIWELNAQSKQTLSNSMSDLAYSLADTPQLKEELNSILSIQTQQIYIDQLIQFVKKQLKLKSNWLLIYDNMISFSEIIHFLPFLKDEWGEGKIIITTRNQHVAETSYIKPEYVVNIEILSKEEKNTLLTKIMYGEDIKFMPYQKRKNLAYFIENIPPFPLDVSIAAYSIKNTHISFEQYLHNVKNYSHSYDIMQAGVIHEASDYENTRYGIIFSTLEELRKTSKQFDKFFFFICSLDSQNIPHQLLEEVFDISVIDSMIYQLRKNGILLYHTQQESAEDANSISIHRITQEIGSVFFQKHLSKAKISQYTKEITDAIDKYYWHLALENNKESIIQMNPHIRSLIQFIQKNNIQSSKPMLLKLYLILGNAYYYWQVNYAKALYTFKQVEKYVKSGIKIPISNLAHLYKSMASVSAETLSNKDAVTYSNKSIELVNQIGDDDFLIARNLRILGEVYRRSSNFEKSNQYYLKALESIPKDKYTKTVKLRARIYANLAELYLHRFFYDQDKVKTSIEFGLKGLRLLEADKPYSNTTEIPLDVDCNVAWHHRKFSRLLFFSSKDTENVGKWIKSANLILQDRCPNDMHIIGRVLYSEGDLLTRQGHLAQSIEKLKKAIKIHNEVLGSKTTWNVRIALAEGLNRIGRFHEAYENAIFTINLNNPEKNYLHNFFDTMAFYHAGYAKYRLEDYSKSHEHFVEFTSRMRILCKKILTDAVYQKLQSQKVFKVTAFDEFNAKDTIKIYIHNASKIYSEILGKDHPFLSDYINLNLS